MPILARVYHEPPSQQHRLTLQQFRSLQADYARLRAEEG